MTQESRWRRYGSSIFEGRSKEYQSISLLPRAGSELENVDNGCYAISFEKLESNAPAKSIMRRFR